MSTQPTPQVAPLRLRRSLAFLFFLNCITFIFLSVPRSSSAQVILDVTPYAQANNSWCWAACGQMVLDYYHKLGALKQCDLVDSMRHYAKSYCCPDGSGHPKDCNVSGNMRYDYFHLGYDFCTNKALCESDLNDILLMGSPIEFTWFWDDPFGGPSKANGAHSVVMYGFESIPHLSSPLYYVRDPWRIKQALLHSGVSLLDPTAPAYVHIASACYELYSYDQYANARPHQNHRMDRFAFSTGDLAVSKKNPVCSSRHDDAGGNTGFRDLHSLSMAAQKILTALESQPNPKFPKMKPKKSLHVIGTDPWKTYYLSESDFFHLDSTTSPGGMLGSPALISFPIVEGEKVFGAVTFYRDTTNYWRFSRIDDQFFAGAVVHERKLLAQQHDGKEYSVIEIPCIELDFLGDPTFGFTAGNPWRLTPLVPDAQFNLHAGVAQEANTIRITATSLF